MKTTVYPSLTTMQLLAKFRSGEIDLMDYLDQVETYFNAVEPGVLAFIPEEGRFHRLRSDVARLYEVEELVRRQAAHIGILLASTQDSQGTWPAPAHQFRVVVGPHPRR